MRNILFLFLDDVLTYIKDKDYDHVVQVILANTTMTKLEASKILECFILLNKKLI